MLQTKWLSKYQNEKEKSRERITAFQSKFNQLTIFPKPSPH